MLVESRRDHLPNDVIIQQLGYTDIARNRRRQSQKDRNSVERTEDAGFLEGAVYYTFRIDIGESGRSKVSRFDQF